MRWREPQRLDAVPFAEARRSWWRISLRTFGGPAGQIAVMHRELVEERRWIGEERFLHALSYCTLLPGPEAQQLAIYLGWLLNGTIGGLVAGVLFVIPGFVVMLALSAIYATWGSTGVIGAIFAGVAPAVVAIVAQAIGRLARRSLGQPWRIAVAVAAFVALWAFGVPFPIVIATAALIGAVVHRFRPAWFVTASRSTVGAPPVISDDALHGAPRSWRRSVVVIALGLVLWWTPVIVAVALGGRSHVLVEQGVFFSGTAVVTFGGAYAVLSLVAKRAVEVYGWLASGEMVHGLALAETTPGPLILVVQFVAFLGAYRSPGSLPPLVAGLLGSMMTVWVTFVPCFLWVFLGAPYIESLRANRRLSAALAGVSSAVVGVIVNLAVFFALHTLFDASRKLHSGPIHLEVPRWSSFDGRALVVAVVACWLVFRRRVAVPVVLGVCGLFGAVLNWPF